MGKEWAASMEGEPNLPNDVYSLVNDMNGMLQIENLHVGQEKTFTHAFKSSDWYPMGNFADVTGLSEINDQIDRTELPDTHTGMSTNYVTQQSKNFYYKAVPRT